MGIVALQSGEPWLYASAIMNVPGPGLIRARR